jgi:hypothetical protein
MADHQEAAAPEPEAWYDAEIAPALAELARRCHERGMSLIAVVEYAPGERGGTYFMHKDAGLEMEMIRLCAYTAPNVDSYAINLRRHCKERGIDTSASFTLNPRG